MNQYGGSQSLMFKLDNINKRLNKYQQKGINIITKFNTMIETLLRDCIQQNETENNEMKINEVEQNKTDDNEMKINEIIEEILDYSQHKQIIQSIQTDYFLLYFIHSAKANKKKPITPQQICQFENSITQILDDNRYHLEASLRIKLLLLDCNLPCIIDKREEDNSSHIYSFTRWEIIKSKEKNCILVGENLIMNLECDKIWLNDFDINDNNETLHSVDVLLYDTQKYSQNFNDLLCKLCSFSMVIGGFLSAAVGLLYS